MYPQSHQSHPAAAGRSLIYRQYLGAGQHHLFTDVQRGQHHHRRHQHLHDAAHTGDHRLRRLDAADGDSILRRTHSRPVAVGLGELNGKVNYVCEFGESQNYSIDL